MREASIRRTVTDTDSYAFLVYKPIKCQRGDDRGYQSFMNIYKSWLKQHGIPFKELPFGLHFQYQGGSFLVADNSGDSQFFQLIMPNIYQGEVSERNHMLEMCNKINEDKKVVKAHITDDNRVWLSTEILIDNTPDVDDFFDRLLQMLHQSRMEFMMKYHQF